MVRTISPVTRPMPIDPLDLEAWPLACALAWIIAIDGAWSPEPRNELIRHSYCHEARALPVDTLKASRKFLDYAASNPDLLLLHHPEGLIERSQLGPDALIFPTKDDSGILTFGLRVHQTIGSVVDIRKKLLGVWCLAREVQAAWPAPSLQIAKVGNTANAEIECCKWLIDRMNADPSHTRKPKLEWYRAACKQFPGLGNAKNAVPSKSFVRAWTAAISSTGAKWNAPGRKKSNREIVAPN